MSENGAQAPCLYANGLSILQYRPAEFYDWHHFPLFWNMAGHAARNAAMWDLPASAREDAARKAISRASLAFFAYDAASPLAISWLAPLANGPALAGTFHFFACHMRRRRLLECARLLLQHPESLLAPYKSLLCFLPERYEPTRWLLQMCGFTRIASLPEACFMADQNTLEAGGLWLRNGEAAETFPPKAKWRLPERNG